MDDDRRTGPTTRRLEEPTLEEYRLEAIEKQLGLVQKEMKPLLEDLLVRTRAAKTRDGNVARWGLLLLVMQLGETLYLALHTAH